MTLRRLSIRTALCNPYRLCLPILGMVIMSLYTANFWNKSSVKRSEGHDIDTIKHVRKTTNSTSSHINNTGNDLAYRNI